MVPVLVADDAAPGGRTALAAVRALADGGYAPWVTVGRDRSLAGSSRSCAGRVPIPPDVDGALDAVREAQERLRPVVLVPASDSVVVGLGLPGAALVDKRVVREQAERAGLPVPEEERFHDREELLRRADDLPYPVVVKPALRHDGAPFKAARVERSADLHALPTGTSFVVQPFLGGSVEAVEMLVLDGRLAGVVHERYERVFPRDCGSASFAVTVEPDLGREERLLDMLSSFEGVVEVELLDGHVIDVNPRAYGSLPLAVRAGANLPALWADVVSGRRAAGDQPVRGQVGVTYRWWDGDLRSVLGDWRDGLSDWRTAAGRLRPRHGTAHSVERWSDPVPTLLRMVQSWRRA